MKMRIRQEVIDHAETLRRLNDIIPRQGYRITKSSFATILQPTAILKKGLYSMMRKKLGSWRRRL